MGASPRAGWGLKTIQNLQDMGFQGEIFPVNPRYEEVMGYRCYQRLTDLPTLPDVAVFAIPAKAIPHGVSEAIELGIPSAVVYASGFGASGQGEGGEVGEGGLRQRLSDLCQGQIAMLGPNCLGVVNYANRSATYGITMPFAHVGTEQGVALVAQSGNMALTAQSDADTTAKYADVNFGPHDLQSLKVTDFEVLDLGKPIRLTFDCELSR